MQEFESLIDLFQPHGVGDKIIQLEFAVPIALDMVWQFGAALYPAKGRPAPDTARDQLERTRRDFLPRPSRCGPQRDG